MYTVSSQTITEDYKAESTPLQEWKFQIENGNTGELAISNSLIDNDDIAQERAKAEFLKNSYKLNTVKFKTHRTDINKNQVINLYGVPYIVKSINTACDDVSIISTIKAVRYE